MVQEDASKAFKQASLLWQKLFNKDKDDGLMMRAATMLATQPSNNELQAQLQTSLVEILKNDSGLATQLQDIMSDNVPRQDVIATMKRRSKG